MWYLLFVGYYGLGAARLFWPISCDHHHGNMPPKLFSHACSSRPSHGNDHLPFSRFFLLHHIFPHPFPPPIFYSVLKILLNLQGDVIPLCISRWLSPGSVRWFHVKNKSLRCSKTCTNYSFTFFTANLHSSVTHNSKVTFLCYGWNMNKRRKKKGGDYLEQAWSTPCSVECYQAQ